MEHTDHIFCATLFIPRFFSLVSSIVICPTAKISSLISSISQKFMRHIIVVIFFCSITLQCPFRVSFKLIYSNAFQKWKHLIFTDGLALWFYLYVSSCFWDHCICVSSCSNWQKMVQTMTREVPFLLFDSTVVFDNLQIWCCSKGFVALESKKFTAPTWSQR